MQEPRNLLIVCIWFGRRHFQALIHTMLEYPKVYVSSYARIFFAPYVQTETNSCKEKKMLTKKQTNKRHPLLCQMKRRWGNEYPFYICTI